MAEFTPHEAPAREVRSLPVAVPAKLIGRDATLAEIYAHLKDNNPVHLYGMSGIGKSALAATLASAYTQQPGGALWLNVDDAPLEQLLVRVGRAYQVTEITRSNNPVSVIGTVARTLAQHKPLIVLDGKIDYNVAAEFVNKAALRLPVLIITKDQMVDDTWKSMEIDRLRAHHSTELLVYASGIPSSSEIESLAEELDDIPYALVVAAGSIRANKTAPADFLKALAQAPAGASGSPQLRALTASFRALAQQLQGIILMMGATFGGQASAELLSMISGASVDAVQQVMTAMAARNLVERIYRYGQPYYRLHEITYAFAQSWLRGSGKLEGLQNKVRDSVLDYARKYGNGSASPDAFDRLAAEMDSILAVAAWAADNGDHDTPKQLVVALTQAGEYVNARGYLSELLRLQRHAASFTTAFPAYPIERATWDDDEKEDETYAPDVDDEDLEDDDELEDELDLDNDLDEDELDDDDDDSDLDDDDDEELGALTASPLIAKPPSVPAESSIGGDLTSLRAALTAARGQSDKKKQVELLRKIGEAQLAQSMENEAISTYSEALSIYEELEDEPGTLEMLDTVATLMAKTENSAAAVLHATRGVRLAEKLEDREVWMHLLMTLGDARQQLGESADAITSYEQALEYARKVDDSQHEALILHKLGYAQLDEGEVDTAIQTWEQALALFKKQLKRANEGQVMGGLGTAYGEEERWSEAMSFYTSALYIAREVSDRVEEMLQLGNLAYAAVQAEQLGQAVLRYRQALHLAYQKGDREDIVSTIIDLVGLLIESPRHLSVAELLVDDALRLEPNDRDAVRLKERIVTGKMQATEDGVQLIQAIGTAQDYAANAYKLLEE